ncbi:metallophosphoesterase [bacterium]|nr:metallophosphoesterase [bacterium]MBU3956235.1 metallophosphoesterase [bacterium]
MKIGIISDSHENMPAIAVAVKIFNNEKVKRVFHAGDIISPITHTEFKKLKCPLTAVFGNNDGEREYLKEKFKGLAEFYDFYSGECGGRRIFMVHVPDFVEEIAGRGNYDIVIYGHTHITDIRKSGATLIINPGECGSWLLGKKSVVILETKDLSYKLIDL